MAVASASASVANTATADAVAGAHSHDHHKGKGKTDFSDALNAILSAQTTQTAQTQSVNTQDNTPPHERGALARVTGALKASTAANGNTTDGSADAISALAAKITGVKTAVTQNAGSKTAANNAADTQSATPLQTDGTQTQTTQAKTGKHSGTKHGALTAATQAKLVSALTQAANAPAKIVGSDGKTAASSSKDGTPATTDAQPAQVQPAQTETPADIANVLAAMLAGQPVVTTVAANADKTEATITPRTMPQLEKAALGNTAQQALHTAAPEAKTEAQALTMPADAKSANSQDGSGAQSGSGQKQPHDSDSARLAADVAKSSSAQSQQTTVPDAPQPAANAPAAQTATNTAVTNAASAIGNNATAQATTAAPATIATTLQVAQQTTTSTMTPDLAALAVSIAAKSKDGQNEFNIRLEPAELGRVDVRLSVDAAGKAQAHLTADKPQTLQMLQRDSQSLERTLRDSGLDLSNNGLNFSLKGEQQNSTPTFNARNRALSIASVQTIDTVSTTSSTSTAPGDSRLDIRV